MDDYRKNPYLPMGEVSFVRQLIRMGHLLDGFMVAMGGLLELSFVSMYAFARGWFRQVMIG